MNKEKESKKDILEEEEEIKQNIKTRKKRSKMSTSNALIATVAVLVIMSGVQVFQTQRLLKAISSGAVKTTQQTQGGSIGLPSQVGGCG